MILKGAYKVNWTKKTKYCLNIALREMLAETFIEQF